jgi:hypothetical protein
MHSILTLHELIRTGEITKRRAERGGGAGIHTAEGHRVAVGTPR